MEITMDDNTRSVLITLIGVGGIVAFFHFLCQMSKSE
jgi:hypothetical protein